VSKPNIMRGGEEHFDSRTLVQMMLDDPSFQLEVMAAVETAIRQSPIVISAIEALIDKNKADRERKLEQAASDHPVPAMRPGAGANLVGAGNVQDRVRFAAITNDAELIEEKEERGQIHRFFRRGGRGSRLIHAGGAILDEKNIGGAGRAIEAIAPGLIDPLYTVILGRLIEWIRQHVDQMIDRKIDTAVKGLAARFDLRNMAADVKRLMREDPDFKSQQAHALHVETREEEKTRGTGFWLRGGPFVGPGAR
jgi:hypothetical protein